MSENSKIEWTDHTFNPFIGCTKVSPGCDHCYAEQLMDKRLHKVVWGAHGERVRTSAATWREPIRWNARHAQFFAAHGRRQRVFCASLADVFDNAVDPSWREDLFALISSTPNLDWLLLTKRIGNVPAMVSIISGWLPDNVWLGATIVNQAEADRDIPKLLAVPARVRFLSMEPLLGPVDLTRVMRSSPDSDWSYCDDVLRGFRAHKCGGHISPENAVNWVIVGGESGADARPMHPDWARDLRDQCAAAGVPFLFKQWGEWAPGENCGGPPTRTERVADWFGDEWSFGTMTPSEHDGLSYDDEPTVYRIGKKTAGRHLDGRTHDEFPEAR
ncbi:phage Gp37/Gp68 family protein [Burkholderia cenocepacia]|uniref:phage Gp37/Gp68 family protein n=1 Tax=Burkholderia cepacia complex TaxID=87882 RepID=UPI00158B1D55|nr:phage Gp37/Gp68 family protein [Burkholderia cenocepacia]MBJ9669003.1 phage Gp37/Gp68 family protein [Burkholderia cenocepacia]